eukprot:3483312-Prymnesium_polylepis.1
MGLDGANRSDASMAHRLPHDETMRARPMEPQRAAERAASGGRRTTRARAPAARTTTRSQNTPPISSTGGSRCPEGVKCGRCA